MSIAPRREPALPAGICPRGHRTFSLLPDCLAARLPGTVAEVEVLFVAVEQAKSVEAACSELRLEIELPGARPGSGRLPSDLALRASCRHCGTSPPFASAC